MSFTIFIYVIIYLLRNTLIIIYSGESVNFLPYRHVNVGKIKTIIIFIEYQPLQGGIAMIQ